MKELAALLVVSIAAGSAAGFALSDQSFEAALDTLKGVEEPEQQSGEFKLGSAHEHALFYVVVDGEVLKFTEERYQLATRHVHLENNRSHIVHKHAENVTWGDFFETVGMTVEKDGDGYCLQVKEVDRCGSGELFLTGNYSSLLEEEIEQGDRFFLVMGENSTRELEALKQKELPRIYTPEARQGRRI